MCVLTREPQFKTAVLFLSSAERNAVCAMWDVVMWDPRDTSGAENMKELEEAACMWGFTGNSSRRRYLAP